MLARSDALAASVRSPHKAEKNMILRRTPYSRPVLKTGLLNNLIGIGNITPECVERAIRALRAEQVGDPLTISDVDRRVPVAREGTNQVVENRPACPMRAKKPGAHVII